MIIHIVTQNETLENILEHYRLNKNDLVTENRHITDWKNLVPGTKLKITLLGEEILEVLDETEPFIEDYYVKSDEDNVGGMKEILVEDNSNEVKEETIIEKEEIDEMTVKDETQDNSTEDVNIDESKEIRDKLDEVNKDYANKEVDDNNKIEQKKEKIEPRGKYINIYPYNYINYYDYYKRFPKYPYFFKRRR